MHFVCPYCHAGLKRGAIARRKTSLRGAIARSTAQRLPRLAPVVGRSGSSVQVQRLPRPESLMCAACGITYKYEEGVYHFYDKNVEAWQEISSVLSDRVKRKSQVPPGGRFHGSFTKDLGTPYCNDFTQLTYRVKAAYCNILLADFLHPLQDKDKYTVEIGCCQGWLSYLMARYHKVIAVDVNPYYLRYIDPAVGHSIVKVCADGGQLPIADNSVIAVVGYAAYHHMCDKVATLNEWFRILEPGGLIAFFGEFPRDPLSKKLSGEYVYTPTQMRADFEVCDFDDIQYLQTVYRENMQYMTLEQLLVKEGERPQNGFILARKGIE